MKKAKMNELLLARGNLKMDNQAIIGKCYEFLKEHAIDSTNGPYGSLNGKLSTVAMAIYLEDKNLRHLMPHNWPELNPLVEIIKKQSGLENIQASWFNILPKNTKLGEHNHTVSKKRGASYGAFVYYPRLDQQDAPLQILSNNEWIDISAVTGDWLCFGLDVIHRVPMHENDLNMRISFSFNV